MWLLNRRLASYQLHNLFFKTYLIWVGSLIRCPIKSTCSVLVLYLPVLALNQTYTNLPWTKYTPKNFMLQIFFVWKMIFLIYIHILRHLGWEGYPTLLTGRDFLIINAKHDFIIINAKLFPDGISFQTFNF